MFVLVRLFRAKDYSTSISTESNKNLESSTIGKVQLADLVSNNVVLLDYLFDKL